MKIISKYKDYYDYYQGIFGMDLKRIYTRNIDYKYPKYTVELNIQEESTYVFYICGIKYTILEYKGKLYHTAKELEQLDNLLKKETSSQYEGGIHFNPWEYKYTKNKYERQFNATNNIITDINLIKRAPVLLSTNKYSPSDTYIPLLASFAFHKIIDAKDIYIKIEAFLGYLIDNPPLPDKQTNIGKIEGHGFDKTRSFRPKMK